MLPSLFLATNTNQLLDEPKPLRPEVRVCRRITNGSVSSSSPFQFGSPFIMV